MLHTGIPADVLLRQSDDTLATIMDIFEERSRISKEAAAQKKRKGKGSHGRQ